MPETALRQHTDQARQAALTLRAIADQVLEDLAHGRQPVRRAVPAAAELDRQLWAIADIGEILARLRRAEAA